MRISSVLVGVVAAAVVTAACGGSNTSPTDAGSGVSVSVSSCGQNWSHTAAGAQHITVRNTDSRSGEAQLIDPKNGAVFADLEPLGPDTTASVDVSLAAGRYAWRCLMEDEPAVTGPTVTVTGNARGTTPGVVPVDQAQLVPATRAYERYVTGQLPRLATMVTTLRKSLANPRAAKHAWLVAHLEYERLGAAYDAFGPLNDAINGLPNGLRGGVHNPGWAGFHRIEFDLWRGAPVDQLRQEVSALGSAVQRLRQQFADTQIDPLQISIRAHEITENALQFELTGQTDFGSHSQLQTVLANLQGTQTVLKIIHNLLAPRYAQLPQTEQLLQQSERDVAAPASHARIDADISELSERLAPIAAMLEPRKTQ